MDIILFFIIRTCLPLIFGLLALLYHIRKIQKLSRESDVSAVPKKQRNRLKADLKKQKSETKTSVYIFLTCIIISICLGIPYILDYTTNDTLTITTPIDYINYNNDGRRGVYYYKYIISTDSNNLELRSLSDYFGDTDPGSKSYSIEYYRRTKVIKTLSEVDLSEKH